MASTFGAVLRATRERSPISTALIFGERCWTYAELDEVTELIAASLATSGVQRDDRVALFLPNCPELLFAYIACFKLGAIAVPLNHRYKQPEAEYALSHSGSSTLIVHSDKLADVMEMPFDRLGVSRLYLVAGASASNRAPSSPSTAPRFVSFELLWTGDAGTLAPADFDERQPAMILYTSGSTAKPKGVVHSHETLWHAMRIQSATMQFTSDDVQLVTTSACHCASTTGQIFPSIFAGGTVVLLDAPTPEQVVDAIVRNHVTRGQMLPTSVLDLVEHLEQHPANVSSLRSFFAGGDVVPLDTHERFRAVVGIEISEVCGMTESTTYSTNPPFGAKRLGSIGQPARDTYVRIVDEHGSEAPVGEQGEIVIQSPANMIGYWNDTLHTASAMRGGWLCSGDLGRMDEDGYFWFLGRKKEIIIHGGSNISPQEVEVVIDQHPAVHASGVVGMADARLGQVVIAYVALRPDVPAPTPETLRAFVADRIAAYKVPERFLLLPELPLNAANKIDRKILQARVAVDVRSLEAFCPARETQP